MSKSILEQLLLDAGNLNEETDKLADKNQKNILENVAKDAIRQFINESVNEEDEDEDDTANDTDAEMDYETSDVDTDTGMDADAEDAGEETEMDVDAGVGEETPEIGDEMGADTPLDVDAGMETPDMGVEDLDMRTASMDELQTAIDQMGEGDKLTVVKNSSFSIENGADAGMDMDMGADMGVEGGDMPMEGMEEIYEAMKLDEDNKPFTEKGKEGNAAVVTEMGETPFTEKGKEGNAAVVTEMGETPFTEKGKEGNAAVVTEVCEDDSLYEWDKSYSVKDDKHLSESSVNYKKLLKLYEGLKAKNSKLMAENKRLKVNEQKAVKVIKESMTKMKNLTVMNANLAHISRLFTENSTTRKEKEYAIKRFDTARTVNESKLIFEMLTENFKNRSIKRATKPSKEKILENTQTPKKLVTEQQTFVADEYGEDMSRTEELMFFTPKS